MLHNPRVQRWLEFLTVYHYTLEYRKGSANGYADFLSRPPLPASEDDRSGHSRLTPSDEERIYLIRTGGPLLDVSHAELPAYLYHVLTHGTPF